MTLKLSNNTEDFPQFAKLSESILQNKLKQMHDYLNRAFEIMKVNPDSIFVDKKTIYKIIDRVEKRRIYFHIYHKSEMGELNEGALFCFWILKLTPFYNSETPTSVLNAKIAFFYLMMSLHFYIIRNNKKKKTNKAINTNANISHDILYAFQYRDLSKEAIMLLALSLIIEDSTAMT